MNVLIALAEDKQVNRNTILQKIASAGGLEVVFVAAHGGDCLDQLKGLPHGRLPQVVFMDLEMPVLGGIEAIRIGKALYPQVHFIVLTVFDDDEKIFEAIRAGATGYLLKHEPASVLAEAVVSVLEYGGAPLSPAIARKALRLLSVAPVPAGGTEATIPEAISERERDILKHLVSGWDAKRISSELGLSVLTVRKHIANIYTKLHVNSKAQVISLAHKNGWV